MESGAEEWKAAQKAPDLIQIKSIIAEMGQMKALTLCATFLRLVGNPTPTPTTRIDQSTKSVWNLAAPWRMFFHLRAGASQSGMCCFERSFPATLGQTPAFFCEFLVPKRTGIKSFYARYPCLAGAPGAAIINGLDEASSAPLFPINPAAGRSFLRITSSAPARSSSATLGLTHSSWVFSSNTMTSGEPFSSLFA